MGQRPAGWVGAGTDGGAAPGAGWGGAGTDGGTAAGGGLGAGSATSVRRHGRETKRARSRSMSETPVALSMISAAMMPVYAARQASCRTREIDSASTAEPYRTWATAPA